MDIILFIGIAWILGSVCVATVAWAVSRAGGHADQLSDAAIEGLEAARAFRAQESSSALEIADRQASAG